MSPKWDFDFPLRDSGVVPYLSSPEGAPGAGGRWPRRRAGPQGQRPDALEGRQPLGAPGALRQDF